MSFKNESTIDKQVRESVERKMAKAIPQAITLDYVDTIKDRIVKRTQLGIGIDPLTGLGVELKPLSDNYKEMRQGKARWYTSKSGKRIKVTKEDDKDGTFVKAPNLPGTTQPAKSNLTATGQLLKSLTVTKIRLHSGIAYLIGIGDRRGRGLFGYPATVGNKQLVKYLADQGRHFMGFTRSQKKSIQRQIRQRIKKFLR